MSRELLFLIPCPWHWVRRGGAAVLVKGPRRLYPVDRAVCPGPLRGGDTCPGLSQGLYRPQDGGGSLPGGRQSPAVVTGPSGDACTMTMSRCSPEYIFCSSGPNCILAIPRVYLRPICLLWQENLIQTGLRPKKKKEFLGSCNWGSGVGLGKARLVQGSVRWLESMSSLWMSFPLLLLTLCLQTLLKLAGSLPAIVGQRTSRFESQWRRVSILVLPWQGASWDFPCDQTRLVVCPVCSGGGVQGAVGWRQVPRDGELMPGGRNSAMSALVGQRDWAGWQGLCSEYWGLVDS